MKPWTAAARLIQPEEAARAAWAGPGPEPSPAREAWSPSHMRPSPSAMARMRQGWASRTTNRGNWRLSMGRVPSAGNASATAACSFPGSRKPPSWIRNPRGGAPPALVPPSPAGRVR